MGIDARILFEQTGDLDLGEPLPNGFEIREIRDFMKECNREATHEIETYSRYYGAGYERGSWPDICAVLMLLHACPGVGRVWYGGDCNEIIPLFDIEDVLETSRHFMLFGHRPYLDGFQ